MKGDKVSTTSTEGMRSDSEGLTTGKEREGVAQETVSTVVGRGGMSGGPTSGGDRRTSDGV